MRIGIGLSLATFRPLPWGSGATVALDFTRCDYSDATNRVGDPSLLPGWTFTRASTKTATTSAGVVQTFASGVPAITDLGFLVEPTATNILLWSQDMSNAAWTKNLSTATANTAAAPDGTTTASTVTATASTGFHYTYQTINFSASAYTHSAFVKRNNNDWVFFTVDDSHVGYFNTATGSLGSLASGMTATVQALANGWYRIAATVTEAAHNQSGFGLGPASGDGGASFTATGTEAVYVWGRQGEAASGASSYIPTTSSTVTRAADAASITFSGSPGAATVTYGSGSTATPSATSPINLGSSSGGAWVGSYVKKLVVQ